MQCDQPQDRVPSRMGFVLFAGSPIDEAIGTHPLLIKPI